MKRVLCLILCLLALSGCVKQPKKKGYVAIATFYPAYIIAANIILGVPDAQIRLFTQPQDGCLREYELSDWDASLMSAADLIVLNGGGLENFASSLPTLFPKAAIATLTINMPLLNAGDQHEHAEVNSDDDTVVTHYDGINPHVYMSVDGAIALSRSMLVHIVQGDSEYTDAYTQNQAAFEARLIALKTQMDLLLKDAPRKNIAIASESLRYMERDYALNVSTVIYREPGSEVLYENLIETLDTLREAQVDVVMLESQVPQAFLTALTDAGYAVAVIDVMSAHTEDEGLNVYETGMLENARALAHALNQ